MSDTVTQSLLLVITLPRVNVKCALSLSTSMCLCCLYRYNMSVQFVLYVVYCMHNGHGRLLRWKLTTRKMTRNILQAPWACAVSFNVYVSVLFISLQYASTVCTVCSVLHAQRAWALITMKTYHKKKWLANISQAPCALITANTVHVFNRAIAAVNLFNFFS